ncbi:MAG TPA: tetratricopeptide repeat protein, partial [Candidatus Baltobacteraceae bacterium]|nr:tetratricopeptide repeat protein [Candidatus Baltobacteraceae bacterium]
MVRALLLVGFLGFAIGAAPALATPTVKMQLNPDDYKTITPSDPAGAVKSTRELIAAGKMDDAVRHLETYVLQHPYEIGPRRFLGDLYVRVGQLDRAQSEYEAILRLVPGDKETHNRLGTVFAVRNRVDDAITQFTAALPGTDSVDDLVALHERRGDLASYKNEMDRIAA